MVAHESEWNKEWGRPHQTTVNIPIGLFDWGKVMVASGMAKSFNALLCQALLDHLRKLESPDEL